MFIKDYQQTFSVIRMCQVLGVSRAGFYAWLTRPESRHKYDDRYFVDAIKTSFGHSKHTYGYRRVYADLKAKQVVCGRDRVARLMREQALKPKMRRRFRATTDSRHLKPVAVSLRQPMSISVGHRILPMFQPKKAGFILRQ